MAISEFQFNLLSCDFITPRVKHFIGKIESDEKWSFIPGQFITLSFQHEDKILRRSYSIANSPNDKNIIEFAASFIEGGPGSQFLFNLKPSDSFKVSGPFGRLILKDEQVQRLFLIGTGTGITPYRSMLPAISECLKTSPQMQFEIIEGVSHVQELLFEDDFKQFCHQHPQIQFHAAISRESSNQKHHIHGRVQTVLQQLNPNPSQDMVYLCGNPQMIDDTTQLLEEWGFPIQKIIREKYISR